MKKQFFTLVMMLAIVVLAGTSAMAQPDGSAANPYFHINNSLHTFTVTANANSNFEWKVFTSGNTEVTTTTGVVASYSNEETNAFTMTWGEDAAGLYYAQVTETDKTNACAITIRRIYVALVDFDVEVYVSNDAGVTREGATAYTECGDGTVANYGDLSGAAFSNQYPASTELAAFVGSSNTTIRYIALSIHWNVPSGYTSTFTPPTIGSITYDATVTTDANNAPDNDFIRIGNVTAITGNVTNAVKQGASNIFVSDLEFNSRWGQNMQANVQARNVTLWSTDATPVRIGTELNANEFANGGQTVPKVIYQNTTDEQIIIGAPATTKILVN